MIKTIFFGSSEYSVIILQQLLRLPDFDIQAVFTKPDKAVGRHQTITPNPVTIFATKNHLPLFQPEEFDDQLRTTLRQFQPDLGLVVAYGPPYFTQDMIDIPTHKIINIHPHLYPNTAVPPRSLANYQWRNHFCCYFFKSTPFPTTVPLSPKSPSKSLPLKPPLPFTKKPLP